MRTVGPAGRLLLLRARTPEGEPVGTLLTVFDRQRMYLWSGGSLRSGLSYQPNEALVWEAVRQAKARGLGQLDMGGGGAYKEKYGVSSLAVPVFRRSSPAVLSRLRDLAREAVATERRVRGRARERMHGSRRRPPVARV